jgi:hypothetical protein
MIGTRQRIADSCARRIFLIVSGHHEPALTVASLATTTTSRPCTTPSPVTTPGGRRLPLVLVVRDEQADLDEGRAGVAEPLDPLARRELPLLVLPIDLVRPAALAEPRLERADLCGELAEAVVRRARGGAPGRAGAADALTRPGPARAPRPARARRTTA